jgi:hypothetical protein
MQSGIEKLKIFENNIEKRNQENRNSAGNIRKIIGNIRKCIGEFRKNIGNNRRKNSNTQKKINQLPYHKVQNWITNNQIESIDSYHDSLSHGQVSSKMWLIENLPSGENLHIEIVGGWFGCPLIDLLNSKLNIKKIDFYEIDESCKKILAQYLNHFDFDFDVSIFDDFFERKELRRRDLIINTSSEHMQDIVKMKQYFKGNPALAIQSNNYFELDEHTNCVHDVEELIQKNQIKNIWYKGNKEFEKYTRFMTIGQWYD